MKNRGQSIVELLVAIAVAAVVIPGIAAGLFAARQGKAQEQQRLEAVALVHEAHEAVRVARESSWVNVATNGTYHPVISTPTWALGNGADVVNGYTRSITIDAVYRNASGTIVLTGGTLDPSTKKVTIIVAWGTPLPTSVSEVMYLTRLGNLAYVQTTKAEFDTGTLTNAITTNTAGGEVTLAAGGNADWCGPNLSIAATDLPRQGVANAVTAIEGRVFAGTGENASGVSFANVTVSNTTPPTAMISGTFDNFKTNGVFGETGYAYLASDNNAKEVVIIDLNNYDPISGKYAEAGYFDAPGNGNGDSVFVSGTTGYMTAGDKLYTFDLTSKAGSRPLIDTDGVTLAGIGKKIAFVGGYAYIAIVSATTQLQIVDVSNPSNLTVVGEAQLNAQSAVDIFVNQAGTRAYIATAVSPTQPELFILDVTTKTGNHAALGTYNANGMNPKGITVVPGNKAILVGVGAEEYQAIDIATETSPTHCGGLNIDTGINGVASVLETDGQAYSYIITGDANSELKIIEGGPGGIYSGNGTYESATFEAGMQTAFNRFVVTTSTPIGTTTQYQFAVADAVAGSCSGATFVFVGPDGTPATRFTGDGALPFDDNGTGYENPGQCFRYKVFFSTTDPNYTPILYDMTVNYSP